MAVASKNDISGEALGMVETRGLVGMIEAADAMHPVKPLGAHGMRRMRRLDLTPGLAFDAHFTPAVEVGWRLARDAWGHGYATEGGAASLAWGFLGLAEIVSFTAPANARSRAVMERLGMIRDPDGDFDHPRIEAGDPLRRQVQYRLSRGSWERARRAAPA